MRCGDLERYLEAFIDGRLGRSRTAILRRHLTLCPACQARVERLRQFERDTQRRFRLVDEPGSIWEGLELNLVGSVGAAGTGGLFSPPRLPPPGPSADPLRLPSGTRRAARQPLAAARSRGRATASKLAGVVLVAMALGATWQALRGDFAAPSDRSTQEAYLDYRRNRAAPMLNSGESRQVADWLTAELGHPVVVPPVPEGYRLIGASRADLAGSPSGALIYTEVDDPESPPVMLFVSDGSQVPTAPVALPADQAADGLHQVRWSADHLSYVAVGPVPTERLMQFHH